MAAKSALFALSALYISFCSVFFYYFILFTFWFCYALFRLLNGQNKKTCKFLFSFCIFFKAKIALFILFGYLTIGKYFSKNKQLEANFFLCIYNSDSCFSVFICDVSRNAKLVFRCSHFAGCAFLCIFLFLA